MHIWVFLPICTATKKNIKIGRPLAFAKLIWRGCKNGWNKAKLPLELHQLAFWYIFPFFVSSSSIFDLLPSPNKDYNSGKAFGGNAFYSSYGDLSFTEQIKSFSNSLQTLNPNSCTHFPFWQHCFWLSPQTRPSKFRHWSLH